MVSPEQTVSLDAVLELISRSLFQINENLTKHCERTAFIAVQLMRALNIKDQEKIHKTYLLSILHTIGFFRHTPTNFTDPMPTPQEIFLDEEKAKDCFWYSQCYLKHMTSLGSIVEILRFHHVPYRKEFENVSEDYLLANILFLASRVSAYTFDADFCFDYFQEQFLDRDFIEYIASESIDPAVIDAFMKINTQNMIIHSIMDTSYDLKNKLFQQVFVFSEDVKFELLKLLIYLMDLKSTFTLNHIIKTSCFALSIANRMGLQTHDLNTLYMGSLLHDIGKLKTPAYILEGAGRLENDDMAIMRAHVKHTRNILQGVIPAAIMENAWHHHEKLNGKGYPQGLTADQLSTIDRIISIADVASALSEKRSYKEGFSKEKVLEIMEGDVNAGALDPDIFAILKDNYDSIREDFPEIQEIMSTNFGMAMAEYISSFDEPQEPLEEIDEIDEIEEIEDLGEVEELEEL